MKVKNFSDAFPDVKIVEGIVFNDERGTLQKPFYGKNLKNLINPIKEVIFVNSKINVIRGMHFQKHPFEMSKLITCLKGKIIDVFIDLRKDSETFGEFESFELSEENNYSLLIPNGFAHGYAVYSNEASVIYLQSNDYSHQHECGINPLSFGFDWNIENPIISVKDQNLKDYINFFDL